MSKKKIIKELLAWLLGRKAPKALPAPKKGSKKARKEAAEKAQKLFAEREAAGKSGLKLIDRKKHLQKDLEDLKWESKLEMGKIRGTQTMLRRLKRKGLPRGAGENVRRLHPRQERIDELEKKLKEQEAYVSEIAEKIKEVSKKIETAEN